MIKFFADRVIVNPVSGCWEWQDSKGEHGYGVTCVPGTRHTVMAHRLSYALHKEFNPGLLVLHRCDVKFCVNPDHLFQGTHRDNVHDMLDKGRHWALKGENHRDAKLTEEDVLAIRLDSRTTVAISKDYGVCPSHVSNIKKRLKWAWL